MIAHGINTYYGKDIMDKNRIEILEKINNKIAMFLLNTGASMEVMNRKAIKLGNLEHKNDFYLE